MTGQRTQQNSHSQNGGEQRQRRAVSRRRKAVFAAVTVLIFLGIVESAARALSGSQPGGRFEQISQIVSFLSTEESGQILESDPDTFWKLRPDVVISQPRSILFQGRISNSLGYRNENFELKRPKQTVRIVSFGDSSTFGIGTPQPQTWPAQLESSLNSDPASFFTQLKRKPAKYRVEVVNAGVPGYTSYQILQRMRRELKPLAPDVVLMTCANNDFWRWDDRTDAEQAVRLKDSSWTKPLRYSRAFQLASLFYAKTVSGNQPRGQTWAGKASRNYFAPEESWTPRVPFDEFRANLQAMADLCEEQNVPLVFVIWPDQPQAAGRWSIRIAYHEAMFAVANERRLVVADVATAFRKRSWAVRCYIPNDIVHVNAEGNRIAAEAARAALDEVFPPDPSVSVPLIMPAGFTDERN